MPGIIDPPAFAIIVNRARGAFIVVGIGQVLPSSGVAVVDRQIGSCDRIGGWPRPDMFDWPMTRMIMPTPHLFVPRLEPSTDPAPSRARTSTLYQPPCGTVRLPENVPPPGVESMVVQSTTAVSVPCCRTRASTRFQFMFE